METEKLKIKVGIQIGKSASEIFEAIVNPEKMANYFIERSSGTMEEGKVLTWKFPEFDVLSEIKVGKVEKYKYVSFYWEIGKKQLFVEINLEAKKDATVVRVTEKEMENDEAGIKWLKGNTEGWANFLACMKAYLEYGINLRKGAFDFMS